MPVKVAMVKCDADGSGAKLELKISGDVDVANAVALQEQIASAIVFGRDVVVDLEAVDVLDGAGVQLLVAFKAFVERSGGAMTVVALGEASRRTLEIAGATHLFSLDERRPEGVVENNEEGKA